MARRRIDELTITKINPNVGGTRSIRRKEYQITAAGRDALREELHRLNELYQNGKRLLGGFNA